MAAWLLLRDLSTRHRQSPETKSSPERFNHDHDGQRENRKSKRASAAGAASWLALVAVTSLGGAYAETVRTEIRLPREARAGTGRYRLIVQSYDSLGQASAIPASAQPRGSAQRAVTADDVKKGVRVDLIEIGKQRSPSGQPGVVVAWVEPGEPDSNSTLVARALVRGVFSASHRLKVTSKVQSRFVLDRRPRAV